MAQNYTETIHCLSRPHLRQFPSLIPQLLTIETCRQSLASHLLPVSSSLATLWKVLHRTCGNSRIWSSRLLKLPWMWSQKYLSTHSKPALKILLLAMEPHTEKKQNSFKAKQSGSAQKLKTCVCCGKSTRKGMQNQLFYFAKLWHMVLHQFHWHFLRT